MEIVRRVGMPHMRYRVHSREGDLIEVSYLTSNDPLGERELYWAPARNFEPDTASEPTKPSGGALRHNSGKTPFSAFPLDLCSGAARVMGKGRIKYAKGNYRKGYEDVESPTDSLIRHTGVVQRAVEADDKDGLLGYLFDESGECHIHHVVTSALLIIQTMQLLGWDVEKTYSRMIKTSDGKCFPEEYANAKGIKGDLYVNGIKQTESKSAS